MAESAQERTAVSYVGTGDYRIVTEEDGTRYRVYPGGERRKLKPRTAASGQYAEVKNMATDLKLQPQPQNNYQCIQPFSAQVPSDCGDFYLDPTNAGTKYVCPKCGSPTIKPLF